MHLSFIETAPNELVPVQSIELFLFFPLLTALHKSRYKGGRQVEITQQKRKPCWENERKRGGVLTAIRVSPKLKNVIEQNL